MVSEARRRKWASRCVDGVLFGIVGASVAGLFYALVIAAR